MNDEMDRRGPASSELPEALADRRVLAEGETFCFGCHSVLECFTRCCHDVNIMLTPVDVLRLARHLKMTTQEFLDAHTLTPIAKDLYLPVVMLRLRDDDDKGCPFLDAERGCGVYEDRPWACRMYPLGMAIPPARAGVEPRPIHFLFEDDYCDGGGQKEEWTGASWRDNQGVTDREDAEQGFREIVSHPWFIGGRQLDPKRMEMFHTAFYNLDVFRSFIFESTFLERFDVEEELVAALRDDDEALLRFASRWLRFALFAEPTIEVREAAREAVKPAPST